MADRWRLAGPAGGQCSSLDMSIDVANLTGSASARRKRRRARLAAPTTTSDGGTRTEGGGRRGTTAGQGPDEQAGRFSCLT